MNVLFVHEKCGHFGGVEVAVAQAAAALKQRGHVCVLAYGEKTDQDLSAFGEGFVASYPVRELGESSAPLAAVMAAFKPDAVFVHKVPSIALCLPFVDSTRVLRMIHDHDVTCPRRHKYYALGGRICTHRADWRCFFDAAMMQRTPNGIEWHSLPEFFRERQRHLALHRVLVGSQAMREELLDNGFGREQVVCLPPVVRWEEQEPSPPAAEPHILYVGQLVHGKGVDLLLRALTQLSGPWHATVVGDGNAGPALQALSVRLGLSSQVQFTGWVSHDKLADFYRSARLVVVPSRWPEPFGLVGLEAMRHGRPVVAFAVGGIPDWLEDGGTGFLAAAQDIGCLAEGMQKLVDDAALAERLGRQGYQRLTRLFSFERYVDGLEGFLGIGAPACVSA